MERGWEGEQGAGEPGQFKPDLFGMAVFGEAKMTQRQQAGVDAVSEPVVGELTGSEGLPVAGGADFERGAFVLHHFDEAAQNKHEALAGGDAEAGWDEGGIEFEVTRAGAHDAGDADTGVVFCVFNVE